MIIINFVSREFLNIVTIIVYIIDLRGKGLSALTMHTS